MASQTASDVGPGVGIKQLEELSLLQNTEGEKGSDANEPSEKYLAYRCSLLDSIAQDTKFKFDTTLEDTEDYSNGGICAESDMLTDLKLYQSGRRRDEDTFVALYDMSIEEADNIVEMGTQTERLMFIVFHANIAAKYRYRANLAYSRRPWITLPLYGSVRRENRISFCLSCLAVFCRVVAFFIDVYAAVLARLERRRNRRVE